MNPRILIDISSFFNTLFKMYFIQGDYYQPRYSRSVWGEQQMLEFILSFIQYFIIIYILLQGLLLMLGVWQFTHISLRRSSSSCIIERDEVPEDERMKLERAEALLLALGFEYRFSLRVSPPMLDMPGPDATYIDIYHHAESDAYAIANFLTRKADNFIGYFSHFTDGAYWETAHQRNNNYIYSPNTFYERLPDDAAVWDAHLRRLSTTDRQPSRDEAQVRKILLTEYIEIIDILLERGFIKPYGHEERWRFTWSFAFRRTFRMWINMQKMTKKTSQSSITFESIAPEKRATMEKNYFLLHRDTPRQSLLRHKWIISIVTAVLFLLVLAWYLNWAISWALFFVVALHEGGHYLAMRFLGYQNASIFFIPGLGAFTVGEKKDASPLQRLLVYLAGPMPGLIIVVVLCLNMFLTIPIQQWALILSELTLFTLLPDVLYMFILFSFILNYLNLLPIPPLDGGRIVEMLAFSRFPRMRFVFSLAGCLIFLISAFYLRDSILLLFGVLITLYIPSQWRRTQLRLAISGNKTKQSEEEVIEQVFNAMQLPRFRKWSLKRRIEIANVLIPEYMARQPRIWEIVAGLVVYLLCLALPAIIYFMPIIRVFMISSLREIFNW